MYGTSRFGEENEKEVRVRKLEKIEEKRLETDEFVEDSQNSRKSRSYSSKTKIKNQRRCTVQRKLKRFTGFAHDVTPAGCGLDFEGISSPQSTAITERKYQICNGVIGGQYRRLYSNLQESANDTHHAHCKMTGSRQGTSIDQNFIFGVTT